MAKKNQSSLSIYFICFITTLFLSGCSAMGAISTVVSLANSAMEVTGIKKADLPEPETLPTSARFDITASSKLNTTVKGESLALVTKIYKLKQNATFEQATYETFLDADLEKKVLGPDLLEVKEIVLVPGQHYIANESLPEDAPFIGVVALFRAPNAKHWRATFSSASAGELGIDLSMLSCVMLVNSGDPETLQKNQTLSSNPCY